VQIAVPSAGQVSSVDWPSQAEAHCYDSLTLYPFSRYLLLNQQGIASVLNCLTIGQWATGRE